MTHKSEGHMPLDDLLVFHKLMRSLNSSFDLDAILRIILEHMERLIEADLWTLLMLDEKSQELYYALASGGEEEALRDLRVKVGEGVAGWVAEHGETLIIPESEIEARLAKDRSARVCSPLLGPNASDPAKLVRVRSVIALPLRGRKGTHGVIEILNPREGQLNDYAIAFLHILADHAAIAIENSRDVARIQQLTITDDTTGLFNVRHLYQVMERELEQCNRDGLPFSLAFLDLDSFKQVNDAHGHHVGSELLARTGKRLQQLSRPQDLCFRYGGDEFVILMPATSAEVALAHIVQLHRAFMESRFSLKNGLVLSVSASVGLATAPLDGTTVHSIIGAADARMYKVKNNGRSKVSGSC
jgi:diguanylate cyclase (GGDEF)-like protein